MEDHEWLPLSSAKSVKQQKIKINRDIKPVEECEIKKSLEQEENKVEGIMEAIEECGMESTGGLEGGHVESEAVASSETPMVATLQARQGYGRGRGDVMRDGMKAVEKGFGRAYVIRNQQLKEVQCGGVTGLNNVPNVGGTLGMYVDGARFVRTSRNSRH